MFTVSTCSLGITKEINPCVFFSQLYLNCGNLNVPTISDITFFSPDCANFVTVGIGSSNAFGIWKPATNQAFFITIFLSTEERKERLLYF